MGARRDNPAASGSAARGARFSFLPIRLAPHVHMCRAGGRIIFLDLARDEYSALDPVQSKAFEALIGSDFDRSSPHLSESDNRLLGALADAGAITNAPNVGEPPRPPDMSLPSTALRRENGRVWPVAVFRAMLACASAARDLKRRPLIDVVTSVKRRKKPVGASGHDVPALQTAFESFETARLFYPRSYLCLFDSLALLRYFASCGLYPDWVFAVRGAPFEAHCWVQAGDVAVNETVEVAATYTPILIV